MEYTAQERGRAVSQLVAEYPYQNAYYLWKADGDTAENIAVNLQMALNRRDALLAEAVELLGESCYNGSYHGKEVHDYIAQKRSWLQRAKGGQ